MNPNVDPSSAPAQCRERIADQSAGGDAGRCELPDDLQYVEDDGLHPFDQRRRRDRQTEVPQAFLQGACTRVDWRFFTT